jgi:hypothetical protein
VRPWAEALKTDSNLAGCRRAQHRYDVARAADLAASGTGKSDPPSRRTAQTKFRQQALEWLKSELALRAKLVASGPPQARAFIAPTLQHSQEDSDLAGVRGDRAFEDLPESKRAAWRTL